MAKTQITHKQQYLWRLERKSALYLIGKTIKISYLNHQHYIKISDFMEKRELENYYESDCERCTKLCKIES